MKIENSLLTRTASSPWKVSLMIEINEHTNIQMQEHTNIQMQEHTNTPASFMMTTTGTLDFQK